MFENLTFQQIDYGSNRYHEICDLRNHILRRPIGLNLFDQDLSAEVDSWHFAMIDGDRVIAYLMITPIDGHVCKLRQMLVVEDCRGQGIGRTLVQTVENLLNRKGLRTVTMSARESAAEFYVKLGYDQISQPFMEIGIPHVTMEKRL